MLSIRNLRVAVEGKEILRGVDLVIPLGEVHAIMGPNGSGKSTLAAVLAGREGYEIMEGEIFYDGRNLLEMEPEERARAGLFLAFQYPVEIPGVTMATFLRTALNEIRKAQGLEPLDPIEFLTLARDRMEWVGIDPGFLQRGVNEGFSGGEKKRNEIFQLLLLEPRLAILDETDSGLDIDALKLVASGVNRMRSPQRAFVVITHYQRLLNYIIPDVVHVLYDGRIVRSGGKELALELEERGYDWLRTEGEELVLPTIDEP
ncbi:MAG: Fe-S cluster assembly ATPase SufC [Candidatus Kapabacteria bacterium]|nr:Fe-S cluster assembly ATPase SufC [Candidatus Kapabacteria bacterium]